MDPTPTLARKNLVRLPCSITDLLSSTSKALPSILVPDKTIKVEPDEAYFNLFESKVQAQGTNKIMDNQIEVFADEDDLIDQITVGEDFNVKEEPKYEFSEMESVLPPASFPEQLKIITRSVRCRKRQKISRQVQTDCIKFESKGIMTIRKRKKMIAIQADLELELKKSVAAAVGTGSDHALSSTKSQLPGDRGKPALVVMWSSS